MDRFRPAKQDHAHVRRYQYKRGRSHQGIFAGVAGVLSLLLWCLVLDEFFIMLEKVGVYAQAYTDDLTMLVGGKYEDALSNLMQLTMFHQKIMYHGLPRQVLNHGA